MINVSLFEKLKSFFEIIKSNEYTVYVIPILLILVFFVILSCRMNDKFMKMFYVLVYTVILGTLIYKYHEQILSILDYLVENIVTNILFPNLAVYICVLLVINIIILVTLFSSKVKLYVKSINIISFAIMQLFLYLIVDNIIANDVNVYEKLSVYTNENLLILIELSMQLFVVWILVLLVIRLIDYLISKSEKRIVEYKTIDEEIPVVEYKNINVDFSNIENDNIQEPSYEITEENEEIEPEVNFEVYEPVKEDIKYNSINDKIEFDYYKDYKEEVVELIEYVPIKKVKKSAN